MATRSSGRSTRASGKSPAGAKPGERQPRAAVPLLGREPEQARFVAARTADRLPAVLLLAGPSGVGKARLAEWMAQSLVCGAPTATGPCGACQACRYAAAQQHPDIHWFFPHQSLGGGSLDAQIEELDAQRQAALAARRADALYPGAADGARYYAATGHAIRRVVALTPAQAAVKVIILTDVERMVAQDGATAEVANALLKVLEEPPANTYFLLTTAAAARVPSTIRSRAALWTLAPLPDDTIEAILIAALSAADPSDPDVVPPAPDIIAGARAHARGSLSRAAQWLDPEWQVRRATVAGWLAAAVQDDAVARYEAVRQQGFAGARSDFAPLLLDVVDCLLDLAGAVGEVPERVRSLDTRVLSLAGLPGVAGLPEHGWAAAVRATLDLHARAEGNGNPQLLLHALLATLASHLGPAARAPHAPAA